MTTDGLVVTLAVVVLLVLIALRTPIFVALGVAGVAGLLGLGGFTAVELVPLALVSQLQEYALVAAPLYILLGEALAVSGLGRDLFGAAHRWFNRVPGGLGASAVGASTVFGAMSGVSISSVAVIGRMAVPEMLERGYRPAFASGAVAASGALAMLIPPSLMFILYSSITGESVADLFVGGLIPGLVLAAMMIVYVVLRAKLVPDNAPIDPDRFTWRERLVALGRISPALLLILLVLGSIYTGITTPTEAAAVGALAAFAVTGAIYHKLGWPNLKRIFVSTAQVAAAVLAIVGAAFVFTQMLVLARAGERDGHGVDQCTAGQLLVGRAGSHVTGPVCEVGEPGRHDSTPGSHVASCGKAIMSASRSISMATYGATPRKMSARSRSGTTDFIV